MTYDEYIAQEQQAMAVSAVGWKYFVYFFSLGYGYGIAALAVAMGVLYHANLTVPTIAMLVLLFIFGARRLELRQNASYGNDPEYQAYVKKTPILIPFLPIYSVAKYEWLKA